jgi:hypothetical protein
VILKWIEEYSDAIQFKLLVCGGDGSVGWLLESISKFKFKVKILRLKKTLYRTLVLIL